MRLRPRQLVSEHFCHGPHARHAGTNPGINAASSRLGGNISSGAAHAIQSMAASAGFFGKRSRHDGHDAPLSEWR